MAAPLRVFKFIVPTNDSGPGFLAVAIAKDRAEAEQKVRQYCDAVGGDPSWISEATVREYDPGVAQGVAWVETHG